MGRRSALLVLAIGVALVAHGESRAAAISYDVAGTSAELTRSSDASVPNPPGYRSTPFAAGSSLTLEFDANGDGVSGDVTIAASRFLLQATYSITFGLINITTDFEAELSGGLGALNPTSLNLLEWSEPASYSVSGTFHCFGSGCSLVGLTEGLDYTYADYRLLFGTVQFLETIPLGIWLLNQGAPGNLDFACVPIDDHICNWPIYTAVTTPEPNENSEWWVGLDLHGRAVPEPTSGSLVAAALLALALGRGLSGTMRRHEVG